MLLTARSGVRVRMTPLRGRFVSSAYRGTHAYPSAFSRRSSTLARLVSSCAVVLPASTPARSVREHRNPPTISWRVVREPRFGLDQTAVSRSSRAVCAVESG
jgi:hypothetical protein